MANWLLYALMGVSGVGTLGSGIFERKSLRIAIILACIAVFELTLLLIGQHQGWAMGDERWIGLIAGLSLVIFSYWIMPPDE